MSDIKNYVKDASKIVYKKVEEEFAKNSSVDEKIVDLKLRTHVGKKLDYGYFTTGEINTPVVNTKYNLKITNGNMTVNESGNIVLSAYKKYIIIFENVKKYSSSENTTQIRFALEDSNGTIIMSNDSVVQGDYNTWNRCSTRALIIEPKEDIELKVYCTLNFNGYITKAEVNLTIQEIGREVLINEVEEVAKNNAIEDTPIGSILGTLSLTAPAHYLICNGTEYNIEDYPKLAQYFLDTLGSINYYGGDGIDTFAVPDFRGEFLRGYDATNIRDPEGSARGIGKHQDGTNIPYVFSDSTSIAVSNFNLRPTNIDSLSDTTGDFKSIPYQSTGASNPNYYTSRPTNVNVLWCIKYEPTYFMTYSPQYMGFDETILFEGEANAVGEYTLNDDIENYNSIEVYSSTENTQGNFIKINPKENLMIGYNTGTYLAENCYYNIRFILDNNKLNIIEVFKGSLWTSYSSKIYKIIGIKSK